MGARSSLAPGCSQHIQLFKATSSCRRRASKGLSGQQEADHDDLDDEEQFLNLDDVLEGNACPLLSRSVVSMCAFAAYFVVSFSSDALAWATLLYWQYTGAPSACWSAWSRGTRQCFRLCFLHPCWQFSPKTFETHNTHVTKLHCVYSEGTAIDMDQTSTTAIPAAVRPPAALLALESTSSATGGDGDAGHYRVSCGCNRFSSQS